MQKKNENTGINRNLTSYGDRQFSQYMRRAFLASAGYDQTDLQRPIVGIVNTSSDYNICHRQMPEMISAALEDEFRFVGAYFFSRRLLENALIVLLP